VTPAPFDRFLAGDDRAFSERQKAGLKTFIATGCAGCHSGANVGGAMMAKFGVTGDYWPVTGSAKPDPGRYAVTKKDEDRYVFRVPMLRNVAKTATGSTGRYASWAPCSSGASSMMRPSQASYRSWSR
jgi:cytochrome c peroxidase